MKTTMHVAADEVMAWVDGELSADAAGVVETHVEECAECGAVAAGFRQLKEEMAEWRVEEAPARLDVGVLAAAGGGGKPTSQKRDVGHLWWRRGLWAAGGVTALVMVTMISFPAHHESRPMYEMAGPQATQMQEPVGLSDKASAPVAARGMMAASAVAQEDGQEHRMRSAAKARAVTELSAGGGGAPARMVESAGPMIARSVSLTVRVQDVDRSRAAVEVSLARHRGYASQMNSNTAAGSARVFTASLRIPAPELAAALQELRGLGHVENESQSGDEVTQQHQDLVARLKNSRETEARLQGILVKQTGRISDVLEVEQEIARVRGEIESMEAEQAGLEHRVEFANVELSLAENYKAEFRGPDSVATQLRNALVTGLGNARDAVLGIVLFAEEVGPTLLVLAAVLALPAWWMWRRYRRARAAL